MNIFCLHDMANKRFIPQIITPEIKANWKYYQVEEAFLSMKGDKRRWSQVAFSLKYTGKAAFFCVKLVIISFIIFGGKDKGFCKFFLIES